MQSFCYSALPVGQGKGDLWPGVADQIAEDEYQTACTQACPAGAIVFGDLNNPEHEVARIVQPDAHHHFTGHSKKAFRLLEQLGTNPKVYYLTGREWVRKMCDQYNFGRQGAGH